MPMESRPSPMTNFAFIHTSHVLIPLFSRLAREILPEFETFHMTDESLIRNTIRAGRLTATTRRRLLSMVGSAREGGADAVMVTCSSIGEAAALARDLYDFPVFRIDEAMALAAVQSGTRIGVAATVRTTLDPTIRLLKESAAASGREVVIVPSLCEGAFEAVIAGDTERHDRMLVESLTRLRSEVDVVVLAQASMVRVVDQMKLDGGPLMLSSPELALRQVRGVLLPTPTRESTPQPAAS
jgi:Asp/Glu/hydantoin racemase